MIKFGNYKKAKFRYSLNLNPSEYYIGYGSLSAVMDSNGKIYLVDPPEPIMDKIERFSFNGLSVLSDKIQSSDKSNVLIFRTRKDVINFIKSHRSIQRLELYSTSNPYRLIDRNQYRLIVDD